MLGFSYGFGMKEGGSESAYDRGWEMMVDFQEDGLRGILWRGSEVYGSTEEEDQQSTRQHRQERSE